MQNYADWILPSIGIVISIKKSAVDHTFEQSHPKKSLP